MKKNNSKITIALPSKLETKKQIDTALMKIEYRLKACNYDLYYKVLLYKIEVSYYREYFTNQFQALLTRKKIKTSQMNFSNVGVSNLGLTKSSMSNGSSSMSSTSSTKKFETKKTSNKYLFTPYKYFHIIYTGMTT